MTDLEIIDGELTVIGGEMEGAAASLHAAGGAAEVCAQGEQAMPGGAAPRTLARLGRERDQERDRIVTSLGDGAEQAAGAQQDFASTDQQLERAFAQLMPGVGPGGEG